MRQLLIFSTILSLVIITGCGTKSDQNAVDNGTVNAPVEVKKLSPNPSPAVNSSQTITAPIISTPQNTTVQSSVATNSAGLNPAHGQPGHKCEIPVGAPLNSAPTTAKPANQNQVITTSAPTVTSTASTTPVKVAAGLNPSHGQPGHRCVIAVGAPLNSTPAASNTTTTTTTTPTVNSNVTPGSISPTTINTTPTISTPTTTTTTTAASTPVKVAKGMNPSHGQPGHRCDIAVGAPLNSPSNTTTPVTATPEPKKQ